MEQALDQALQARLHILGEMNKVLAQCRDKVSENARRFETHKVHPDKIRDIIGNIGATIRSITEETGASEDIDDEGARKSKAADRTELQPEVHGLHRHS